MAARTAECTRGSRTVSLVLVGDMAVGKTTLSRHFVNGVFTPPSAATLGVDFHVRTLVARTGERLCVRVWDTAGMERYRSLLPVTVRGVHGCMVVYDVTRRATFDAVGSWLDEIRNITGADLPCVLLGNKTDVQELREVRAEEGVALAHALGGVPFFETSALDGTNVERSFLTMIDIVSTPTVPDAAVQRLSESDSIRSSFSCCWR